MQTGYAFRVYLGACLLLLGVVAPCLPGATDPPPAVVEFFEKDVRPLLIEKCIRCHGETKPKAGLRLTSRSHILAGGESGPGAVAGKPDESRLIQAVRYRDMPRMPPSGKLTDRQIEVLERWVKLGLPWPGAPVLPPARESRFTVTEQQRRFWAFQPVRNVSIPAVRDTNWPQSPVDRFILAKLEAEGLTPAGPADRYTLLRRVSFDLTGLPPTPAEIEAFVLDRSPQAFVRVVDRLLASPAYGERWGRHWLDVVRYADARDLIQLPPASDFREAYCYRDWVVESFNRDLPYTDFLRHQIAGDLLPPPSPQGINRDGLIATGMLALADFVPGDVDKEQMIADCVNDQIDVVSRAFLGLTVACARCHDHKFDPISTEDYYGLAGIFFSTRIIPGPVPGNTPLIRVPLVSPAELAQDAADKKRRAELQRQLAGAADREYHALLGPLVTGQTARYLVAACAYRQRSGVETPALAEVARQHRLEESLLAGWVGFLERVEKEMPARHAGALRDAASGKLAGAALERAAARLQQALVLHAAHRRPESPAKQALARAALFRFRADDPQLGTDAGGRVTLWPNRAGQPRDARPPHGSVGPQKASVAIGGQTRTVLHFDGRSLLEAPGRVPRNGSLFVVYQTTGTASAGQRLLGWEDASVGRHGLGLMPAPGGRLHAILRDNGREGDLVDSRKIQGFEIVCVSWGPKGTSLHRNGTAAGTRTTIAAVSSDPVIAALRLGGPGSGDSPRFQGDVAEVRVYDRQLSDAERVRVEAELRGVPPAAPRDPVAELYDELLSPRGPYWVPANERARLLPPATRSRLTTLGRELAILERKPPLKVEQAVVVQEGGPRGTRHEGFKDAHVYLRGNHKTPGKTVPRGFPRILTGDQRERITRGSGRQELVRWMTRADHPLTARVMVNRIWQHHFGTGLVRTPSNFGLRGERPTHPELLDYLALRFVESGWSVKAMHRLIVLSSAYQMSSRADAAKMARDPDNHFLGRMSRRRLEAEAIRDSLLAVAGRLDAVRGGPAFADLAVPRRTLYLQSVRTGASTSDFGRLFDRADPGSMVARRGESVVAPQALFFLNDPAVSAWARDLAARVARAAPASTEARIRQLYALALGRPPTPAEIDLGMRMLRPAEQVSAANATDAWERYCHLILCTNEFVFLD